MSIINIEKNYERILDIAKQMIVKAPVLEGKERL